MPGKNGVAKSSIQIGNGFVDLIIYVKPKSKDTGIISERGELIFHSTQPPERGKVNASLIKFLSKLTGISSNKIEINRGEKDRVKTVRIYCDDPEKIAELFAEYLSRE